MSQKIASASASGSTSGFFRASSAGSTGRHSSPPAEALSPPAPVAARTNTPTAVNRINREFRCRERWDFIAEAFQLVLRRESQGFSGRVFGNLRVPSITVCGSMSRIEIPERPDRLVLKAQRIYNFNDHSIRNLRGGDDVSYQKLGPCVPTLPCRFPLSLADNRFSAERKACLS